MSAMLLCLNLANRDRCSFMLASQAFLEELMQFFADRCGGMAVMILAGAGKVMV